MREMLDCCDADPDELIACQTIDSAAANKKTARLLSKPRAPCHNHLLQSEVNLMSDADAASRDAIDAARKTMKEYKGSIKNAAVLRNTTKRKPITRNAARWAGKAGMLAQCVIMRDDLEAALESVDSNFIMSNSINFNNEV